MKYFIFFCKMGTGTSRLLRNQRKFLKILPRNEFGKNLRKLSSSTDDSVNTQASKAWSKPSVSNFYEKTRPDYNPDSVEFLLGKIGALGPKSDEFVIVDVGAGTGKYTRAMIRSLEKQSQKNVKIIATEPVEQMCKKFREMVPDVEVLQCPANDIQLPSNSVDAIVAAQSMHWFSDAESISDIHRVLKPKGYLGIVWNLPDRSVPWIKIIEEMLELKYKEYKVKRPEFTMEWLHQINSHGGFGPLNENDKYKYKTEHSFEDIIHRYESISVVAGAEKSEKRRMLNVVENAVKSAQVNVDKGVYILDYIVSMKWFQKK